MQLKTILPTILSLLLNVPKEKIPFVLCATTVDFDLYLDFFRRVQSVVALPLRGSLSPLLIGVALFVGLATPCTAQITASQLAGTWNGTSTQTYCGYACG